MNSNTGVCEHLCMDGQCTVPKCKFNPTRTLDELIETFREFETRPSGTTICVPFRETTKALIELKEIRERFSPQFLMALPRTATEEAATCEPREMTIDASTERVSQIRRDDPKCYMRLTWPDGQQQGLYLADLVDDELSQLNEEMATIRAENERLKKAFDPAGDYHDLLKRLPNVSPKNIEELKELSLFELRRRWLIQKDWLGLHSRCLDGLNLNIGVDKARDPRDIRRVVVELQAEVEKPKKELHRLRMLEDSVINVLDELGADAVRVREGGGPENLAMSIAVSIQKVQIKIEALSRQLEYANDAAAKGDVARHLLWGRNAFSELGGAGAASEVMVSKFKVGDHVLFGEVESVVNVVRDRQYVIGGGTVAWERELSPLSDHAAPGAAP